MGLGRAASAGFAGAISGGRHRKGGEAPLRGMIRTADAVIIGGGVTGASLAFSLASRGVSRVVILERKFLAAGGTGRSVGIIRQLYPNPEACRMVLNSLRVFQNFSERVGGESGYVGCGALIGVSSAMLLSLERSLEIQREVGIRAELLPPAELSRVEPRIDASGLGAVLFEPEWRSRRGWR